MENKLHSFSTCSIKYRSYKTPKKHRNEIHSALLCSGFNLHPMTIVYGYDRVELYIESYILWYKVKHQALCMRLDIYIIKEKVWE